MDQSSIVLQPNEEGLRQAGELLRAGRLVAFPTETVYGLGANALNEEAARGIFTAKRRPTTDPLIVHVVEVSDAERLTDMSAEAEGVFTLLGERFWPGPLTIIVKASDLIPGIITANTGMVGIRSPSHPIARRLLTAAGVPVAAPSANLFGHVSPTRCEHVVADLGDQGIHVVNGDSPEDLRYTAFHGIESTVAKLDPAKKNIYLLRQGAVTRNQIEQALHTGGFSDWTIEVVVRSVDMSRTGSSKQVETSSNEGECAPGQAITHYAPNIPCVVASSVENIPSCDGTVSNNDDDILLTAEKLRETVVIDFGGMLFPLKEHVLYYTDIAPDRDAADAARSLFLNLREAELKPGANLVVLASIAPSSDREAAEFLEGIGPGLVDRMQRAASGVRVNIKYTL